jgi:hypothetical protein
MRIPGGLPSTWCRHAVRGIAAPGAERSIVLPRHLRICYDGSQAEQAAVRQPLMGSSTPETVGGGEARQQVPMSIKNGISYKPYRTGHHDRVTHEYLYTNTVTPILPSCNGSVTL